MQKFNLRRYSRDFPPQDAPINFLKRTAAKIRNDDDNPLE